MKRFKKVYIEITNVCNLSCNFCPKTSRLPEMMDANRFGTILAAVKPYTDHIYFHLMGEPLLNPNIQTFLQMSHEAGLKVNLTTNGTLLNQASEVLLNAPALRQVNISLSSFEANVMTQPLEDYLTEVANFVNLAAAQSQLICSIRLWNMDTTELKGSNDFNEQILTLLESQLGLEPGSIIEHLKTKNSMKLKERIYLNMAEKFEWPDLQKSDSQQAVFCYGLRDQMGILADGTVVPCCLDSEGSISLGNVLETPLEQILSSERACRLFDGFSNRVAVETLCQKCGYARRY